MPLIESIVRIIQPGDEIIIVEGGSTDSTYAEAVDLQLRFPKYVKAYKQTGKGKFDAVIKGVRESSLPMVMVWDADATVNFEQNQLIYLFPESENRLITGDRLRGKRDRGSMRLLNLVGNWLFALLWSFILRQRPIDLLCGTKKFPRHLISDSPDWLLNLDPYGDFSILAMAKINSLEIISLPVHYHSRSYGKTNIHRWSGGVELLKITLMIIVRLRKLRTKQKL